MESMEVQFLWQNVTLSPQSGKTEILQLSPGPIIVSWSWWGSCFGWLDKRNATYFDISRTPALSPHPLPFSIENLKQPVLREWRLYMMVSPALPSWLTWLPAGFCRCWWCPEKTTWNILFLIIIILLTWSAGLDCVKASSWYISLM